MLTKRFDPLHGEVDAASGWLIRAFHLFRPFETAALRIDLDLLFSFPGTSPQDIEGIRLCPMSKMSLFYTLIFSLFLWFLECRYHCRSV